MKKLLLYCLLICSFIAAKADPVITTFTATPSEGSNIRITGDSLSVNFYLQAARSYPPQGGGFEPGTITLRLVYKTSSGQIEPITDYKTYNAADYNNGAFLDIHINNVILRSSNIGKTVTVQYSYWSSTAGQTFGPMLLNGYYSVIGNPPDGTFYRNSTNGYIYVVFDGLFRHIYTSYIYNSIFDTNNITLTQNNTSPTPIGEPLGLPRWPSGTTPLADAFLARGIYNNTPDDKVYLVEALNDGNIYYYYARWITTYDPAFIRYHFGSDDNIKRIPNLNQLLADTSRFNGCWIKGPNIN
ncbi:hypothetical protein LL912_11900 [Niabella sp. CC-SYL272]|uniref:hypothetical protein n=1 Tax=Niabella agricola TaxID=2891571 RepID=UPI001F295213|nr:hypothetical protein [Niabella agricola]MCF3109475.1 hypothetical protein [Niabella agricola]